MNECRPSIELVHDPVICWAAEHCGVPLIRECRVENPAVSGTVSGTLEVQLLEETLQVPLPELGPGASVELGNLGFRLPAGRLRQVTEMERAEFRIRLQAGEEALVERRFPVEILPCHHWPGLRLPPGLLTAFITPNHPAVAQVLKSVSNRLKEVDGSAAIVGYQARNPLTVRAQVMALFQVFQTLGLSYIGAPASFEQGGQKVRFPDMVLDERMADCLDLTLFMAACLEQMDLRPLVVFTEGHAFPGVWLLEERFPEGVVEDAARLRNLIALGQLLVWDSSATLAEPPLTFAQVQGQAEAALARDESFRFALDVRVMRLERFLPLPLHGTVRAEAAEPAAPDSARMDEELREALQAGATEGAPLRESGPPPPPGRWQRWKDRLLDLSLRNRLLNFRPQGASSLPLEVPDLAVFEDLLSEGKVFDLLPRPPQDSRDERDLKLLAQREDAEAWRARRMADLQGLTLHSGLAPGDFLKRAKELETLARTDLEEGGVSTVYAAMGLLRWFEPGDPKERFAPLMLYPVQILFNRQLRRVCLQRLSEDPAPNVTLVEKLRRDFGVDVSFLDALEPDAAGIDVEDMVRRCREAIQRIPRWEILEEIHLGHFTFAKFLMWKDLEDNAELLLKNPVVRHLAREDPGLLTEQPGAVSAEAVEAMPPDRLPCILDADSTQLSAVASALAGRSFVLQGPPGTGKSQTIANLIACAVAQNKSVLFVSEKMAALEVVHGRLRQAGLEDFCLELHSHKANRKAVLESFQKALERNARAALEGWETSGQELARLRQELDQYVQALHEPRPAGFSFFEGSARLHELQAHQGMVLRRKDLGEMTAEPYQRFLQDAASFAHRAEALGPLWDCPWTGTDPEPWSHRGQEDLAELLPETRRALLAMREAARLLESATGQEIPQVPGILELLARILAALDEHALPEAALRAATWAPLLEALEHYHASLKTLTRRKEALGARWLPALLEEDLAALHAQYQEHADAFPPIRWFRLRKAARRLRSFASAGLPSPSEIAHDLGEARAIQEERRRCQGLVRDLAHRLEPAPWAQADALPGRVADLHRILGEFRAPQDALVLALWRLPHAQRQEHTERLGRTVAAFRGQESALLAALGMAPQGGDASYMDHLEERLKAWEDGLTRFKAWSFYREAGRALEAAGFPEVVAAHGGGMPAGELILAAERAFLDRWCACIRDQEATLRGFDGSRQHGWVDQFREADRRWIQLSRAHVLRQLEARLPVQGQGVSETSEMGILLREIRKKARHMAIRKLLQAIPTLLPRLKPCLLMSPISVAQYLPAEGEPFDLLVFDEASQITTHDAIGALARGRQVVVVGDSRQLPPTAFFTRNLDDETDLDDNDVTELESILEEAEAKQFPRQMLGWHYRSRHHTLIDFSNHHYYEDRLHVFPAAARNVADLGIAWHPVPEGVYHGSGCGPRELERTNPIEAERLADHLAETLRRTAPGSRSFGIVTFSMAQQRLIQELLDERRERFPEIEAHFQGEEPVFIKNLENVQGDERDEILFSIGYAKDAKGRLRMHFGPLSLAGGERRLNVAVTRARCQLRVFSTLTHDQIDLSRTAARGAEHLRDFLRFAARHGGGGDGQRSPQVHPGALERDIAQAIEAQGFEVHAQVGCGGYRIDLAVVDPRAAGRYVLGVECDGRSYGSARAARDRDRLRRQVLEGLGWRLHRIWSPDWIENRAAEAERLRQCLQAAVQAPFSASAPVQDAEARKQEAERLPGARSPEAPTGDGRAYQEVHLRTTEDPERFYAPESRSTTESRIREILAEEAPIHRDDLDGKVVRSWGWSVLNKRGKGHMEKVLAGMEGLRFRGPFVWRADQDPDRYEGFRTPGPSGPRDAGRIPPEEIANAMALVLRMNVAMEDAALLKETARQLGYKRLTGRLEEALKAGLPLLLERPGFEREGTVLRHA